MKSKKTREEQVASYDHLWLSVTTDGLNNDEWLMKHLQKDAEREWKQLRSQFHRGVNHKAYRDMTLEEVIDGVDKYRIMSWEIRHLCDRYSQTFVWGSLAERLEFVEREYLQRFHYIDKDTNPIHPTLDSFRKQMLREKEESMEESDRLEKEWLEETKQVPATA